MEPRIDAVPLKRVRKTVIRLNIVGGPERWPRSRLASWAAGELPDDHVVFVARRGRAVLGWGAVAIGTWSKCGLVGIYVRHNERGRGLGEAIAFAAMSKALADGAETIRATNDHAYAHAAKRLKLKATTPVDAKVVTPSGAMTRVFVRRSS